MTQRSQAINDCLPNSSEDVIRNIIAVLASNGGEGMLTSDLISEYSFLVGRDVPWQRFNCANLDDFLKRFPDRIQCVPSKYGSGNRYVLAEKKGLSSSFRGALSHPECPKNVKTRTGSHRKPSGLQKKVANRRTPGFVPAHIRENVSSLIQNHPNGVSLDAFLYEYCEENGVDLMPSSCMCSTVKDIFLLLEEIITVHPGEVCMLYPSESIVQANKAHWLELNNHLSEDRIRRNIGAILTREGNVRINSLQTHHFHMHKQYIDLHHLGFKSLTELINRNQDLFSILRDENDNIWVALK